jgi:hypothetical protein
VAVVKGWGPIGRLVCLDGAACAFCFLKTVICGADADVGGTSNLVNMVGNSAIGYHWIDTSDLDHATAHYRRGKLSV